MEKPPTKKSYKWARKLLESLPSILCADGRDDATLCGSEDKDKGIPCKGNHDESETGALCQPECSETDEKDIPDDESDVETLRPSLDQTALDAALKDAPAFVQKATERASSIEDILIIYINLLNEITLIPPVVCCPCDRGSPRRKFFREEYPNLLFNAIRFIVAEQAFRKIIEFHRNGAFPTEGIYVMHTYLAKEAHDYAKGIIAYITNVEQSLKNAPVHDPPHLQDDPKFETQLANLKQEIDNYVTKYSIDSYLTPSNGFYCKSAESQKTNPAHLSYTVTLHDKNAEDDDNVVASLKSTYTFSPPTQKPSSS